MKFASFVTTAAIFTSTVHGFPLFRRQTAVATPEQIAQLAPDLGALPNNNPNQSGDCDGPRQANGEIPKVPCACPPLRDEYIRQLTLNVEAGHAVNNPSVRLAFPTGNSIQDKHDRITAAVITLQNLQGPGKGCPGVSTTLGIQSKNLDTCGDFQCNGNASPASSSAAPAATTSAAAPPPPANPNAGGLSREEVDRLAPQLGGVQNNNPTGTGDCDGPPQPDGSIKKVPCACPPDRTTFINQLLANIQAGQAVNNPSVKLSFPTGNTPQDKKGRITAATITLQNLNGPGRGCPNVSTTLAQQSLNVDRCGEFECGGVANVSSTESRSSKSQEQGVTEAPNPNTPTPTLNGGASSTTTITITTVVTSVITVTRGQEQKQTTAPPAATSAPAPILTKAGTTSASVAQVGGGGGASIAAAGAGGLSREEIDRLAPQLGGVQNNNPTGTGDCDGPRQPDGTIKKVPCACPPDRSTFIDQLVANIAAGQAVNNPSVKLSFPAGNSAQDKKGRITAATITLQNLNGPGRGCPNVSTTLAQQSLNVDACGEFECGAAPAPAPAPAAAPAPAPAAAPAPAPAAAPAPAPVQAPVQSGNSNVLSRDVVDQLAPQLGSEPNRNPTGTGDCDGPPQPDGSIKKVPCACPPTRPAFIDALMANLAVGHAVNNPSVSLSFPTGNSREDKLARINAGTVTLQNLNGPGRGCPNVSTTFAQQALQA